MALPDLMSNFDRIREEEIDPLREEHGLTEVRLEEGDVTSEEMWEYISALESKVVGMRSAMGLVGRTFRRGSV